MKISDYIFLAKKNLSRRKGSVISITILITIAVIISILSFSFTTSLQNSMDKAINKNISYRTIAVMGAKEYTLEDEIKKIEEDENLSKVVDIKDYEGYVNLLELADDFDSQMVCLMGTNKDLQPNVVKGRNFGDDEEKVCIVPDKLYTDYSSESYDKDKYIDGKSLIGKEITIEYYAFDYSNGDTNPIKNKTFNEEYTVVGVYAPQESLMGGDVIFVKFSDLRRINQNVKDNTILDPKVRYSSNTTVMAIVNDAENVDSSLKRIESLGYRAVVRSTIDTNIVLIVNIATDIVLVILASIILTNIVTSSIRAISERKYEIGIMKAIGYKNSNIQLIMLCENMIIGVRAYLIGLIISVITKECLTKFLIDKNYSLSQLNIKINVNICIIVILIIIVCHVISSVLASKKFLKETPVSLNKER